MKQGIFTILSNRCIADGTFSMKLGGDTSAIVRGGQFVDIEIPGYFLRRPIAVQEWDKDSLTIIFKVVGKGTEVLSGMKPGDKLDLLTGLGNGFNPDACSNDALVVCGGIGASPAFSLTKELIRRGRKVTVILGFNKADDIILFEEYHAIGADVRLVTLDGSVGLKGFVTDAIKSIAPAYDYFYTCGPKVMMKAVCELLEGPGEASLEERMGCGCGICYGCTCHTKGGARRICADGPVFKKEDIIW